MDSQKLIKITNTIANIADTIPVTSIQIDKLKQAINELVELMDRTDIILDHINLYNSDLIKSELNPNSIVKVMNKLETTEQWMVLMIAVDDEKIFEKFIEHLYTMLDVEDHSRIKL